MVWVGAPEETAYTPSCGPACPPPSGSLGTPKARTLCLPGRSGLLAGVRCFVALVVLSLIRFWRVSKSASVRHFGLLEATGVSFYRTKSCGPIGWHRRALFKSAMSWGDYLSEDCKRQGLPADQPIFSGGEAVLEDGLTNLLRGSLWSDYAWQNLKRGGAASC